MHLAKFRVMTIVDILDVLPSVGAGVEVRGEKRRALFRGEAWKYFAYASQPAIDFGCGLHSFFSPDLSVTDDKFCNFSLGMDPACPSL